LFIANTSKHAYNDILSHSVFELWVKGGFGVLSNPRSICLLWWTPCLG